MSSRVLVIVDEFSPVSETFIYNQVLELSKHLPTHVVCSKRMNSEIFPYNNCTELVRSGNILSRSRRELELRHLHFLGIERKQKEALNKSRLEFKPTCVIVHFGPNLLKYFNWLKALKIPVLVFFHGYDVSKLWKQSFFYRKGIKKVLRSKYIFPIVVSQYLQKTLETYIKPFNKIQVQYLGIDYDEFILSEIPGDSEVKKFVQVSRLVPKKGIEITLKAFSLFKQNHPQIQFRYDIVGDGILKEILESLAIKLDIKSQVVFHGFKSQDEVLKILNDSDVYVQHSIISNTGDTEGLPISLMEAMALNMPIVSTQHSGIPELIDHRKHGLLVKENDIDAMSQALFDILSFNNTSGREKIKDHFSLMKNCQSLIEKIKQAEEYCLSIS